MILTPSLGTLARLWSVSYSYVQAGQLESARLNTFRSYAHLTFEIFQKNILPGAPQPAQSLAHSVLAASSDLIRRWERGLSRHAGVNEQLLQITNLALATRDQLVKGASEALDVLRPKLEEAPNWVREIVVHGGFDLFCDDTSPRDVNPLSALTGIPPWMTAGLTNPGDAEGGVIASIFNQTPAEIDAQCAWAVQGFRAHFGDEFVDRALKGYRKHPEDMSRAFWQALRAEENFERILFTAESTPAPPAWPAQPPKNTQKNAKEEEEDRKIRFFLSYRDLKGRKPRSVEVSPILVLRPDRGLKLNLLKLGLAVSTQGELVKRLWKDYTLRDLTGLVDYLTPREHRTRRKGKPIFTLDLHSASLRVFFDRKVGNKTLRRNLQRFYLLEFEKD